MVQKDKINVSLNDQDEVKIFSGLKNQQIIANEQLLEILDINAEQLTYYLEDAILENPFIDLAYGNEQQLNGIDRLDGEINEVTKREQQSLETYLFEQIMLYRQTEIRDTMVRLIEFLDERGFLPYTSKDLSAMLAIDEVVVLDAMTLFKELEPAGIGAYDLRESLMIQTEQDDHAPAAAYYLLKNYFEELSEQAYGDIVARTTITQEEILNSVNYYHTLRSNPAALFDQIAKINLIPDITIAQQGENIAIRYNRQYYPKIIFNQSYYNEMLAKEDPDLKAYLLPHKANFQKLANDLRLREQLILEVSYHIARAQVSFFSHLSQTPTSLSIRDVALASRLPIAIIYGIIENKNLEFNGHVYALSDFINVSHSMTREGLHANYLKDKIAALLEDNPNLSDEELKNHLQDEQIIVSSQIIASYRKNLK